MIQTAMDNFDKDLAASKKVPLPTSVAMSQGYIGIDLQNAIKYELYRRDLDMKVSTILSQVEVDEQDEAFEHPSKPIGRFMTEEEAKEKEAEGIRCMEDAGRGYRVVVADAETNPGAGDHPDADERRAHCHYLRGRRHPGD